MMKKKVKDFISFDWELEEFLFNDEVFQSSKIILNECILIEKKVDELITMKNEREKQLKDIFVKHHKQYTPQDM